MTIAHDAPAGALVGAEVVLDRRRVLDRLDLDVRGGEVVGLIGPNGGGKTTALRALLGLVRLASGKALLGGLEARRLSQPQRAARAGYLPQGRRIAWNLPAWRVAALGDPLASAEAVRPRALEVLHEVGLGHAADRGVLQLSGGEQAKVLLARLLLASAPLLAADEPAAGLDPGAQFQVMEALRVRARRGAAVLVSLHDLTLAVRYCDRLVLIGEGRAMACGTPDEVLTARPLQEAFDVTAVALESPAGPVIAVGPAPAQRPPMR